MAKRTMSRMDEAILETAEDFRKGGLIDQGTYEKITLRHLGQEARQAPTPLLPEEIRRLREREHMSQAAFASRLNLAPSYLSQLERGVRRPGGATVVLLNTIQRHGIGIVPAVRSASGLDVSE